MALLCGEIRQGRKSYQIYSKEEWKRRFRCENSECLISKTLKLHQFQLLRYFCKAVLLYSAYSDIVNYGVVYFCLLIFTEFVVGIRLERPGERDSESTDFHKYSLIDVFKRRKLMKILLLSTYVWYGQVFS